MEISTPKYTPMGYRKLPHALGSPHSYARPGPPRKVAPLAVVAANASARKNGPYDPRAVAKSSACAMRRWPTTPSASMPPTYSTRNNHDQVINDIRLSPTLASDPMLAHSLGTPHAGATVRPASHAPVSRQRQVCPRDLPACRHADADGYARQKKPRPNGPGFRLMPDDDLLSHGETPHYHRRRAASLLSSRWIQVVQTRYGRQANR